MVTATRPHPSRVRDPLRFRVSDVTGLRRFDLEGVDGHRTAGDVAMSVAGMMELPAETRFSFRSRGGRMLVDDEPLGSQLDEDAAPELVVIPRAHLG
jgi:hypothetical protein